MPASIDLTGKRFGRLVVVERADDHRWSCRCDCGNEKTLPGDSLRSGQTRSCGCLRRETSGARAANLAGLRTGKLVVIERDRSESKSKRGEAWWICRCDCGQTASVRANSLTGKRAQRSCRCAQGKSVPDLVGQRFGKLVVIERIGSAPLKRGGGVLWSCACDCGKMTRARTGDLQLTDHPKKSCGCLKDRTVDLVGQRFGRLVVVKRAGTLRKNARWECMCDCGATAFACSGDLRKGRPRSCGCLRSNPSSPPQTWTHLPGTISSPERVTWQAMRTRCANLNNSRYGGRGIKVYLAWVDNFDAFFEYVGPRPSPDHSLDRFPNNDGNYEPGNVRWATRIEQAATRSTTKVDEWGKKFLLLWFSRGYKAKDIAEAFGIGTEYANRLKRQLCRDGEQV